MSLNPPPVGGAELWFIGVMLSQEEDEAEKLSSVSSRSAETACCCCTASLITHIAFAGCQAHPASLADARGPTGLPVNSGHSETLDMELLFAVGRSDSAPVH